MSQRETDSQLKWAMLKDVAGCLQGKMPWHKVTDEGCWSQGDSGPFRNTWMKAQNAPISFYSGIMLQVTQRERANL